MRWNEMKWNHVMFCYHVMSARVVYGLATWPYPKCASSTEKADNSKPLHQSFRLFRSNQRPANKAGNGMVLFLSVLGCDMERGAQMSVYMGRGCHQWGVVFCLLQLKTKGSFTAFSAICIEEGWQKQTTALEFPAVQQATSDRQKRMVTAWCCFSECLVVTWLLGEHEWWMTRWNLGMKICILANSEHVIWRFLKDFAPAAEFWYATSGCLCGICFWQHDAWEFLKVIWYPRWTHHQASPALYQRSGCMKDALGYTPMGEDEMRWNESCHVMLPCHVGKGGLWLSHLAISEIRNLQVCFHPHAVRSSLARTDSGFLAPCWYWFRAFHTHRHTHTKMWRID